MLRSKRWPTGKNGNTARNRRVFAFLGRSSGVKKRIISKGILERFYAVIFADGDLFMERSRHAFLRICTNLDGKNLDRFYIIAGKVLSINRSEGQRENCNFFRKMC